MLSGTNSQKLSRLDWSVFCILICVVILSFVAVGTRAQDDGLLHVYFLDVGQGDSIFIQMGENQILVDGGPDGKVIRELAKVMPFGDRSIDALLLTHPDADHINGLIEVFEKYDVVMIFENFLDNHDSPTYDKWNNSKNDAQVSQVIAGQRIYVGDGAYLEILYPPGNKTEESKTNNNSIIAKLIYGDNDLLLTGDIEAKVEHEIIARGVDLDADLLKVAHHGSKTSTTEEFLNAVTPDTAFIQLGADNRYGHPHPSVVQRLDEHDIKYYRTDIDGIIEVLFDGEKFSIIP